MPSAGRPPQPTSAATKQERPVRVDEVRVLGGPNLYFSRPAIKVTLHVPGYLWLRRTQAAALAGRLGMRSPGPGKRGTALRQRFVMRVLRTVMRRIGAAIGAGRLGVRVRVGASPEDVVVAFPWVNQTRGRLTGELLGEVLTQLLAGEEAPLQIIDRAAERILAAPEGPGPTVLTPTVPVVSVTGTNGKTTTTRLLAHLCMTAGLRTAWSSTDGVVVMGETVEEGDYSGPAGARAVLETPGLEVGILETARGGMLLKGMGVTANDVSIVTNVSADHLGLQGIETLDQLAEVKAIVTTVTRPTGWVVLNGDDPRVWAMHSGISAKPWAFSLDPDAPALWESINAGGRGITVLDGEIVVVSANGDPDRLVRVLDVPMTLGGLSRNNIANALAGAAAGLGIGLPRSAVVDGLRSFLPDPEHNWGRLNTYTVPFPAGGHGTVIMDMAHNEAGLEALLEVARGLTVPGAATRLVLGCAGDRTDEAIRSMGGIAGREADDVAVKVTDKYLRGRQPEELSGLLMEGLAGTGMNDVPCLDSELAALRLLVDHARAGDVVAVMCHGERVEVDAWIRSVGGRVDDPRTIRRKVVTGRGEHELEAEIREAWAHPSTARATQLRTLLESRRADPRLEFEYASALDADGRRTDAIALYRTALAGGLVGPHRHRAQLQLASALRASGRPEESLEVLDQLQQTRQNQTASAILRALAQADLGLERQGLADLVRVVLETTTDPETQAYRGVLSAGADDLARATAPPSDPPG